MELMPKLKFVCLFVSSIIIIPFYGTAQELKKADLLFLSLKEDSLVILGEKIVNEEEVLERFTADSFFTRILVRALKTQNSFNYPFKKISSISNLYSPDSTFRIFTWQVSKDQDTHRRHGAIQMKTKNGELKLFPLIDRSNVMNSQKDTITNNEWWFGAIYYKIIKKDYQGISYYTLLGYDENSIRSTKKRIEVLYFDPSGKPIFGGDFFTFKQDSIPKKNQSRFWIEYKKNGNARITFDDELNLIIYDHLISETSETNKVYTYIPDGDYEGFKWTNGKWLHINKVFNQKLKDGEAPIIKPIKENKIKSGS
jgi:hypothetical protein